MEEAELIVGSRGNPRRESIRCGVSHRPDMSERAAEINRGRRDEERGSNECRNIPSCFLPDPGVGHGVKESELDLSCHYEIRRKREGKEKMPPNNATTCRACVRARRVELSRHSADFSRALCNWTISSFVRFVSPSAVPLLSGMRFPTAVSKHGSLETDM